MSFSFVFVWFFSHDRVPFKGAAEACSDPDDFPRLHNWRAAFFLSMLLSSGCRARARGFIASLGCSVSERARGYPRA